MARPASMQGTAVVTSVVARSSSVKPTSCRRKKRTRGADCVRPASGATVEAAVSARVATDVAESSARDSTQSVNQTGTSASAEDGRTWETLQRTIVRRRNSCVGTAKIVGAPIAKGGDARGAKTMDVCSAALAPVVAVSENLDSTPKKTPSWIGARAMPPLNGGETG